MNHDKNCICMNMEERIKKDFFFIIHSIYGIPFLFSSSSVSGEGTSKKNKRLIRS